MKKYICEFIGTLVLVLFGCGVATILNLTTGTYGIVGISLAFGLAIVAMAYVIGNISGCHVNPAVSLAMLINKKMTLKDFIFYVIAQLLGAFAAIGILLLIVKTSILDEVVAGLGSNGYGEASLVGINLAGAIVVEIVLTFIFVFTVLGVTSDESKSSIAGIVIGLTLAFVHLLGITLTGTSVNPARSLAPAVFDTLIYGTDALKQVWVFIVAPLVGAALAALAFKFLIAKKEEVKEAKKESK